MNFGIYLENKIIEIILKSFFGLFLTIFLYFINISFDIILLLIITLIIINFIYYIFDYFNQKKKYNCIIKTVDKLEEKYLIADIIARPKNVENMAYYYALKKACKSLNDKLTIIENNYNDYVEYIESFVHEIKTPISAISLYCDNKGLNEIKNEIFKINNLVEQILYYGRSKNTENDYFVKKIQLEDFIHPILINYKNYFLQNNITINIHDLKNEIYTDEKWLTFIIYQIIQNSVKYLDKDKKEIEIYSLKKNNKISLYIKDNGIGISESEIPKIFEKGYTGKNRKKEYSTGIGLYLCKKLCTKLNLNIKAFSKEKNFTEIEIIFPVGNIHKL